MHAPGRYIKGISAKWPPIVRSEMIFLPMSVGRFLKGTATRCRRPSFSPITSYPSLRPSGRRRDHARPGNATVLSALARALTSPQRGPLRGLIGGWLLEIGWCQRHREHFLILEPRSSAIDLHLAGRVCRFAGNNPFRKLKLVTIGMNWARIRLINLTNPTRGPHEVPPDKALRFTARDDHEMHMTSLIILSPECSNMLGKLKVDLTRNDAVERVARIELA
jgi:hypothetical protein